MRTVQLAQSGLTVSKLGLGLSHIHRIARNADRNRLIHSALDLGITHFDTARMYGDGISEQVLGSCLKNRRAQVTIATKFGILANPLVGALDQWGWPLRAARSLFARAGVIAWPKHDYQPATFLRSLGQSLKSLDTDYVDILFVHEPAHADSISEGLLEALSQAKRKGMIRFSGISANFDGEMFRRVGHAVDVIQCPERNWLDAGFSPHLSFGVFAGAPADANKERTFRQALARRAEGGVIVGTSNTQHLAQLASWSG